MIANVYASRKHGVRPVKKQLKKNIINYVVS